MKIKVLDYNGNVYEYDICETEDLAFLLVKVVTGDEIIEVYEKDKKWGDGRKVELFDPAHKERDADFLDAVYLVYPEDIELWNSRTNTYCYKTYAGNIRFNKGFYINIAYI